MTCGNVTNSMTVINVWGFLPPVTKLRQGNVFTPVCDSVRGGVLCPGVGFCVQRGVSVRGVSVQRVSVQEVSLSRMSLSGGGASVQGEVLGLGGSLSRGCLCPEGLCPGGVSVRETPRRTV